jgi:hypothetical protein
VVFWLGIGVAFLLALIAWKTGPRGCRKNIVLAEICELRSNELELLSIELCIIL